MQKLVNGDACVAVAMSGGVDSAVVAALVVEQGVKAFGITARMTEEFSKCCADEDICRARQMCTQLGIEHYVVDVCAAFQSDVIEPFMAAYVSGITPSPCVNCNRSIKFGALLEEAIKRGANKLATGHYCRLLEDDGVIYVRKGVDESKDQSYFLARLNQDQLARSLFPLGDMRKTEVSQLAADFDLAARKSRESQDLCFVTEGTHGEWLDLRSFDTKGEGDILDEDGRVVGRHKGVHHYTIGQRKGLGIALGYPAYVIGIDAEKNTIRVGGRSSSLRADLALRDVDWTGTTPVVGTLLSCQVRYNHKAAICRIVSLNGTELTAEFNEPQFAVTPGQLAVFYDGDRIKGSGWISG